MTEREIKDEIKIRRLVIKKLDTAITALDKTTERTKAEKRAKLEELMEYKTYNEAQDAYGWGMITEKEFDQICDMLEHKEKTVETPGIEECASNILKELRTSMYKDIHHYEFELLPREERLRILKEQAERARKNKESA